MNLVEQLTECGLNEWDLEKLVLDAAELLAADCTDQGLEAQVQFLTKICGWSEKEVLDNLALSMMSEDTSKSSSSPDKEF